MKKLIPALILALCSLSAFADRHDVPTAEGCVTITAGQYNYTINNHCAQPIEVKMKFPDGNSDLNEIPAWGSTNSGDGHEGYRYFACFQPAYATTDPNGVVDPTYSTVTFWCRNNFN